MQKELESRTSHGLEHKGENCRSVKAEVPVSHMTTVTNIMLQTAHLTKTSFEFFLTETVVQHVYSKRRS